MAANQVPSGHLCQGHQSPINLRDPIVVTTGQISLQISWPVVEGADLVEGEHGPQVVFPFDDQNKLTVDGKAYHLVSFHFHHRSEHVLEGVQKSIEVQVVHRNIDDGSLAVLGILVEPDAGEGPGHDDEACEIALDPKHYLPPASADGYRYFRYEGSLTTPPYLENVTWVVLADVRVISRHVLEHLLELCRPARQPQPLNRRFLLANFEPPAASRAAASPRRRRAT